MTKLERLLHKCAKLTEPEGGTAQEYNETLRKLGRHLYSLYANGKIIIEDENIHIYSSNTILNISSFVKDVGNYPPNEEYNEIEEHRFSEEIAHCHIDLSRVIEESNSKYHVSYKYYRGDDNPKGVPAALADLILRVFRICFYFEIDIESVLIEKHELHKRKYMESRES